MRWFTTGRVVDGGCRRGIAFHGLRFGDTALPWYFKVDVFGASSVEKTQRSFGVYLLLFFLVEFEFSLKLWDFYCYMSWLKI